MRRFGWGLLPLSLLLSAAGGAPAPEDAALRTSTERIVLPSVQREDLLAPAGDPASWSQRSAITVLVEPPAPGRGWELKLRPGPGSAIAGQSPRVYWKLDSEPPSDFRPLRSDEQLVVVSERSRQRQITVDLAFGVDWEVAPGRYDVDFVFSVEPL